MSLVAFYRDAEHVLDPQTTARLQSMHPSNQNCVAIIDEANTDRRLETNTPNALHQGYDLILLQATPPIRRHVDRVHRDLMRGE